MFSGLPGMKLGYQDSWGGGKAGEIFPTQTNQTKTLGNGNNDKWGEKGGWPNSSENLTSPV